MAEFHPLRSTLDDEIPEDWKQANQRAASQKVPCVSLSKHLDQLHDDDGVYVPAEDTYLLIDAVCHDLSTAPHQDQSAAALVCLEIGCGSGAVIEAVCREQRNRQSFLPFATDLNVEALQTTRYTMGNNASFLIQDDLASSLRSGCVDIMLFNPPYVPTPDQEVDDPKAWAWAGGERGRRVVDRWMNSTSLPRLLKKPHGVAYLVTVDDNRPHEMQAILDKHNMTIRPILRKRAKNEYLSVQKITYK